MTATAEGYHVVVLLQHHIFLIVKIQQTDGLQCVRHAAGGAHFIGRETEGVHDGAHRGVVSGPEAAAQREWTGAFAVVGVVSAGRDDPA